VKDGVDYRLIPVGDHLVEAVEHHDDQLPTQAVAQETHGTFG